MMNELKTTTELVKSILEQDKQCRNSDSFLYLKVLSTLAKQKGIDLEKMSVPYFLINLHWAGFPGFETVRRTRQKLQQHHPDLAACEAVEGFRTENEQQYRAFARSDI